MQSCAHCSTTCFARTSVCLIATMSNLSTGAKPVAAQVDCDFLDKLKQRFSAMW